MVDFEEQHPPAPPLVEVEGPSGFLEDFFLSVQQAHPPPAEETREREGIEVSSTCFATPDAVSSLSLANSPRHMQGLRSESTVMERRAEVSPQTEDERE